MKFIRLIFCILLTVTLSQAVSSPWSPMPNTAQASTSVAEAIPLPAGFVDEPYVTGLLSPRTFAWTPDGRLLVVERGSADSINSNLASIRIFQNGALLPQRAYTRQVCGSGERGFLGLAVDRDFASNGYLYIYYSALANPPIAEPCGFNTYTANQPGPRNTISRLTMIGNTIDPASEVILINNIATDTGIHNAGDLLMDAAGYLYASVGDSSIQPNLAQNLDSLNGKILRIKPQPNGTYTTEGNLYNADPKGFTCGKNRPPDASYRCREIFSYGYRNPFRFTLKPDSNSLFVADVGGGAWEEINDITIGDNAGHSLREGPCEIGVPCAQPAPPSGYTDPVYSYPHTNLNSIQDAAVIGGAFYTGTTGSIPWPAEYLGNYFFTDNVRGFIRRLKYNPATYTWSAVTPEFGAEGPNRGIIGLRTGPDGNLYYLTYMSDETRNSEIRRIRYQPAGNLPPEAQANVIPMPNSPSTQFVFSAEGSSDPDDNNPLQYRWDFGDGSPVQITHNLTITHQYSLTGTKVVSLAVIDSGNPPLTSPMVNVQVFVGNTPPTATVVLTNTTQADRSAFRGGDVWRFTATQVSDDTPLPSDAFSWSVVFHHRDHTHPFLANIPGPTGVFTLPTTGEVDPVVWYRVTLFLKDSAGQISRIQRDIYPETATLRFQTSPSGGTVQVDGESHIAPVSLTRTVGMYSVVDVPSPQSLNGRSYAFQSWTQGGPKLQQILVPVGGATYTANLVDVGEAPTPTPVPLPLSRLYFPVLVK